MALIDKTLGELKEIGFYLGIKGVAPTQTKAKMVEKIEAYLAENPDVSLPTDEEVGQVKKEVTVEVKQSYTLLPTIFHAVSSPFNLDKGTFCIPFLHFFSKKL